MPAIGVPKNYEFGEEPFANPNMMGGIQIADDFEVHAAAYLCLVGALTRPTADSIFLTAGLTLLHFLRVCSLSEM